MNYKQKYELLRQHLLPRRVEKIESVVNSRTRYIKLILEDIYYTQNISAVVRTCECMGIQDVHIIGRRNQSRVNKHVSLGASQWISLYQETRREKEDVLRGLKERGYCLVATVPREEAVPLYDFDITASKTALIMGAEARGITSQVEKMADAFVTIPMGGFSDSYNISVATAVCLYEFMKKLKASGLPWELSEEEKDELRYLWTRSSLKRGEEIERAHEIHLAHPNDQDLKIPGEGE